MSSVCLLYTSITCDGWVPGPDTTASPLNGGHTGARACLVCGHSISKEIKVTPFDAGVLQASAYLRAPEQDGATAVGITLIAFDAVSNGVGSQATSYSVSTTAWGPAQIVAPTSAGAERIVLTIRVDAPPVGCVLVDDVVLLFE